MNLRERIGAALVALGQIGPFDELWDGVDPSLERIGNDRPMTRPTTPDPTADDDGRRRPAA